MPEELPKIIENLAKQARTASLVLARASTKQKNEALQNIAEGLESNRKLLIIENQKDLDAANESGLSEAMIDRLRLTHARIDGMAKGLRKLIDLPDPVGVLIEEKERPNGLKIKKVRVPIGVIGIIYESRPNVTIDCAGLCLKSGNASLLRGGKEAIHSNTALASIIQDALEISELPNDSVQLVPTVDRAALTHLLTLDQYIHCVIPRGGESLINFVTQNSRVPVIKHYKGVCNLFVEEEADLANAVEIAVSSKCGRPGVCNAIENLIVSEKIAQEFLPLCAKELIAKGCELRVDEKAKTILSDFSTKAANNEDFAKEFLDLRLAIKVVESVDEAISFVNQFGSGHSESILTQNKSKADQFLQEVDASSVYWNASTRYTDGFEFGLGAEIGISTDRLHARGPMGLDALCTYKYNIIGTGQWK
ncbi:MAG: glutamate-5-semialdehyde dehydrogenase [Opitutales bacterium]|nr:glutamate-5-semialdehyde dehydrogenase [Opitutales bacterium]MDG1324562.1 glutamate-5-semialdehyde dehydrogenase [Opitutales bacterium]